MPISRDRVRDHAARCNDAQPAMAQAVGPDGERKPLPAAAAHGVRAGLASTAAQDLLELLRTVQATGGRKSLIRDDPGSGQRARRLRPLARRAFSTLRPPSVFMRARNPCVRALRILDG